jgi:hypothetical protein
MATVESWCCSRFAREPRAWRRGITDWRFSLTVWLDGDFTAPDGSSTNASVLELNASEAMRDVAATAATLRQSNEQRALSRAVYADEYEQSLVECMSNAPRGMEEMLEAHYEHCRAVKKQPGLKALVDALREHRRQVEANTRVVM